MMPSVQVAVGEMLRAIAEAQTAHAKGRLYEDLVEYLFTAIPGCIVERNVLNDFGSEQVDLGIGNVGHPDGLMLFPRVVLIECKNWEAPVDSAAVGYFINILSNRGIEVGILVAAHGITGNAQDLTHAHSLGIAAAPRGVKVLVVTTDELEALTSTADLVELLTRRYLRAVVAGSIGVPDGEASRG